MELLDLEIVTLFPVLTLLESCRKEHCFLPQSLHRKLGKMK